MKKLLLAALTTVCFSVPTLAQDSKVIEQSFKLDKSTELEIDFPVGKIDMNTYDGDTVVVTIRLEPKDTDDWLPSSIDLSDIELHSERVRSELSLSIDNDDVKQEWEVKVPKSMRLDVEVGVGKVEIKDLANSADIEVGVGKVRIDTLENDFKKVSLDSGVGKTSLTGLVGKVESQKKMVSSQTDYHGEGKYSLDIEVGVGNIKVRH